MDRQVTIDGRLVMARIDVLKAKFPELAEDADLLADTIEGQTDFAKVMGHISDAFLDAVSMKDAIAARMAALRERGERYDKTVDALRGLALDLMQAAEQDVIRLPEATIIQRTNPATVVVDDAGELPQGMYRLERFPLKTEIKKALDAGEPVPGAHLQPGSKGIAFRTK